MVKSAGSDRSGTYGTCRGGRSSLLGGKRKWNKKKQGRKEKNRCCGIIPKLSAKWFFFWVPGLGCGKYSSGLQWITGKIWRLAGRNVLLMKRLYLPARRWKTVFPSRKRTSAWECVWEPERIVPCCSADAESEKGSKGLLELLKQESQEAFEERRRQAKTTGEKASTKLLLPMGMMLAVVLVILTVPAFCPFMHRGCFYPHNSW